MRKRENPVKRQDELPEKREELIEKKNKSPERQDELPERYDGAVLTAKNLKFTADGKEILKGVSLSARKGEFIGLIGPNGAGKTTLLKCINGINPCQGEVEIMGVNLRSMKNREIARKMAFMHQNTVVTFPFTALDVVLMGRYSHLDFMKNEGPKDYEIARECMAYTGTGVLEAQPVTSMSGGEFQRVMFAKTLAQDTPVLLLDEPTSNLDIAYEEQMFRKLEELCGKGRTIIAAVHDLKIAARYCTRLILMKEGLIVADGTVGEVFNSDNISHAYGVETIVYRNTVTGFLDFYIP